MTTDGAGSAQAEFDVVVVGSGAAGMTAALTAAHHGLRVVVIEKTGRFGGSTARSGGGLWLPGNEVLRRAGVGRHARAGPRLPGLRGGRRRHRGAAAGAARARPGHARLRARQHPGGLRLGTGLRRLLPGGARRAGPGAQHRAGTAERAGAGRRAGPPQPALRTGTERRHHHPGRLPLAEPGPPPPPGHPRQREDPRPGGPHPPAPAADAQPGPGPGGGPAGWPAGPAGTGLAGHPDDRPAADRTAGSPGSR